MRDPFSKRPAIRTVAQLGQATALIVALQRQQEAAQAELDAELAAVQAKHARKFTTVAAGERISIGERIEQLQSAVTSYTDKKRGKLLTGPGKTIHLPGGSIELRDEAPAINFVPGMNRRLAAASLVAVEGFQLAVNGLLDSFGLLGWVVLTPDLDWDGIKRLRRSGQTDNEELATYGMTWTEPVKTRITPRKS